MHTWFFRILLRINLLQIENEAWIAMFDSIVCDSTKFTTETLIVCLQIKFAHNVWCVNVKLASWSVHKTICVCVCVWMYFCIHACKYRIFYSGPKEEVYVCMWACADICLNTQATHVHIHVCIHVPACTRTYTRTRIKHTRRVVYALNYTCTQAQHTYVAILPCPSISCGLAIVSARYVRTHSHMHASTPYTPCYSIIFVNFLQLCNGLVSPSVQQDLHRDKIKENASSATLPSCFKLKA